MAQLPLVVFRIPIGSKYCGGIPTDLESHYGAVRRSRHVADHLRAGGTTAAEETRTAALMKKAVSYDQSSQRAPIRSNHEARRGRVKRDENLKAKTCQRTELFPIRL